MSDSIDRVFSQAISTIKALSTRSNNGSLPRPPAGHRIKLYGLYKQATEGDVVHIIPRPQGFLPEDEAAKKKWDAWRSEHGLSMTQAKRQYISFLIETIRIYADDIIECRELLSELEYMWNQIKDIPVDYADEIRNNYAQYPPWLPLISQFCPSMSSHHQPSIAYKRNIEQIYSHSRKSNLSIINDAVRHSRTLPSSQILSESDRRGFDEIWQRGDGKRTGERNGRAISRSLDIVKRLTYLASLLRQQASGIAKSAIISFMLLMLAAWWLKRRGILQVSTVNDGNERIVKLVISTKGIGIVRYISQLLL